MISRRDKLMLKQLAHLRDNRLRIAELNVAKAKRALEEAERQVEQAKQELADTRTWCQSAYRRVNESLSRQAISSLALYKWKARRNKIRAKLDEARAGVDKAKNEKVEKEGKLDESRKKHRESTLDIERLKMLRQKME